MAELGLQTIHESSALWMRRGYPLAVFEKCLNLLHEADVNITVHVIIGLPLETKEMMYETVRYLNHCGIDGVKLQLLHYLKGTDLGAMYENDPQSFHVLTLEEYTEIIAGCIGILHPDIVIHRLTGDGNGEALLAPLWSRDKRRVLNMIRHELKTRNIVQGCLSND
jgi:radical SAM protein (TIGR01212 family)